MTDQTVGDVARSSAARWNLPIVEDLSIAEGAILFIHHGLRFETQAPGIYVRPGADLVTLRSLTAKMFDSTEKLKPTGDGG